MIDAGSSGSRVHVYRFNVCNDPVLEDEVFHMLEPGLSSFRDDAEGAANSLKPLMEIAVKSVPEEYQKCTPIAVKATAGLRMLGADKSERILDSVRKYLETYPFPIAGENGIEIMEGKDEGKLINKQTNTYTIYILKRINLKVFMLGLQLIICWVNLRRANVDNQQLSLI